MEPGALHGLQTLSTRGSKKLYRSQHRTVTDTKGAQACRWSYRTRRRRFCRRRRRCRRQRCGVSCGACTPCSGVAAGGAVATMVFVPVAEARAAAALVMSGMGSGGSMRGSGVGPGGSRPARGGQPQRRYGRSSSAVDMAARLARRCPRSQLTAADILLRRERALAVPADAKQ